MLQARTPSTLVALICRLAATALLVAAPLDLPGQKPALVKDLTTTAKPGFDAAPEQLTLVGNDLFFTAYTAATGRELFASAGGIGRPYLVLDLAPGAADANPKALCGMGGRLYFAVGARLYASDATAAGTVLIATLPVDITAIDPVGNRLFVRAGSVWFSDGTPAGTVAYPQSLLVSQVQRVGARLCFTANATNGTEVWWTDATVAGTARFPGVTNAWLLGSFGNRVVYSLSTGQWMSDGTPGGTVSIGNFRTFAGAEWQGAFYFLATPSQATDVQLFVTNGTAAGTRQITSLAGERGGYLVPGGAVLFMVTTDTANAQGLWRTDGTAAGTLELLARAHWIHQVVPPVAVGTQLVFAVEDFSHGVEPWITDGTRIGTRLLLDVNPGWDSAWPGHFTLLPAGRVGFTAQDGRVGTELWATDGSGRNTFLVGDLDPTLPPTAGSNLRLGAGGPGRILVRGDHYTWISDGTAPGTIPVGNLGAFELVEAAALGADTLFVAGTRGQTLEYALRRTDGTAAGTRVVRAFASEPRYLTEFRGSVYFAGVDAQLGSGLWRSDGTPGGTVLVKTWSLRQLVAWHGSLYAIASDSSGHRLYRSDGTAAGTVAIAGAITFPLTRLLPTSRYLYWIGDYWLYRIDENSTSPTPVVDTGQNRVFADPFAEAMPELDGVAYFIGGGGPVSSQFGLWRSDGTAAGTFMVATLGSSAFRREVIVAGGRVYLFAETPLTGHELWTSDGTAAGTRMLKDIGPGSRSGLITHRRGRQMVEVGDWLYFAANDWVFGAELWRTDGTAANTQMVYDLAPGAASALPREFLLDSGSLLFTADDGFHGEELFRIEVPAHALELGPGCAPRASPRLSATTPQLARRLTLRLDHPNSLPNAAGLLVVGWQPARPVPMGSGCTLFVDLGVPYLTEPVWLNNGRWSIVVQVPGSPSLHGVDFAAQAVIGPSAQPPFGLDLSNGVLLALRR